MHKLSLLFVRVLSSQKFFYFIVGLLVFQAVWIVLSFSYPMLWDEYYHFGLAQFYAHHLSPIFFTQPESLDLYGNVVRSPKYFYHFLMGFPLRGFSLFTSNEAAQVIFMRLLNVAMFAGALVAYRQIFVRIVKSRALVNFVLLMFVLLPMSSLMAAHVNYDNMQFLFSGLIFYWLIRFIQAKQFEVKWLLLALGLGMVTCVVKQTFLPVLLAIVIFLTYFIWKTYGKKSGHLANVSFNKLGLWTKIGLLSLFFVGFALCTERFGGNLVMYHALEPECEQVLSVDRCLSFSPWKAEQQFKIWMAENPWPLSNTVGYTFGEWFRQIYDQFYRTGTQLSYGYFTMPKALKIPFWGTTFFGAIGVVCFLIYSRTALKRPEIKLFVLVILALTAALWLQNLQIYYSTGAALAIQGRYLLPVVPLFMLLAALGVQHVITNRKLRLALAAGAIICLAWGGGLTTHIVISNPEWYWQNQTVVNVNEALSKPLSEITW